MLDVTAGERTLGLIAARDLPEPLPMPSPPVAIRRPCVIWRGSPGSKPITKRAFFAKALSELRIPAVGVREAAVLLARAVAAEISSEAISARAGAERIWNIGLAAHPERFPEFDTFVYGASEWQDHPEDAQILEDGIREAARDLLR